jgi:hypothetical protein
MTRLVLTETGLIDFFFYFVAEESSRWEQSETLKIVQPSFVWVVHVKVSFKSKR